MPYKRKNSMSSKRKSLKRKNSMPCKRKSLKKKARVSNKKTKKGGSNTNNNLPKLPDWLRIIDELTNKISNYDYNKIIINEFININNHYEKAMKLSDMLMNYEKDCVEADKKQAFCNELSGIMNKCNFIKSDRIKCEKIIVLLKNPIINIFLNVAASTNYKITMSVLQDKVMELAKNFYDKFTEDDDITKQILQLNIFYKQLKVGQILEDQNIDIKEVLERNEDIKNLGVPSDNLANFVTGGDLTILTNQEDKPLMLNENVNSIKTKVDNHEINVREDLNTYFDKYLNISIQKGGVNTRILNEHRGFIEVNLEDITVHSGLFIVGGIVTIAVGIATIGVGLIIAGVFFIGTALYQEKRMRNKKKLIEKHYGFSVIGKQEISIIDKNNKQQLAHMNKDKDKEFIINNTDTERYKTLIPFIVIFNLVTDKLRIRCKEDIKPKITTFMEDNFSDVFEIKDESKSDFIFYIKTYKNQSNKYYEHRQAAKLLSMFTDSQMKALFNQSQTNGNTKPVLDNIQTNGNTKSELDNIQTNGNTKSELDNIQTNGNTKPVFKFKKLINPTTVILRYIPLIGQKNIFKLSKNYSEETKQTTGTISKYKNNNNINLNGGIQANLKQYKEILDIDKLEINPQTVLAPEST